MHGDLAETEAMLALDRGQWDRAGTCAEDLRTALAAVPMRLWSAVPDLATAVSCFFVQCEKSGTVLRSSILPSLRNIATSVTNRRGPVELCHVRGAQHRVQQTREALVELGAA